MLTQEEIDTFEKLMEEAPEPSLEEIENVKILFEWTSVFAPSNGNYWVST